MDLPKEVAGDLERLLEELRVALPGVQILFAFLLTVPFAQRFEDVSPLQRDAYFATLVATFVASAFMIAPSSYHRLRFQRHSDPQKMLRTANLFAIVGLAFLALALTSAMLFVTDFIFTRTTAVATTTGAGLLLLAIWYGVPLRRYLQER
ncbi:MAG: DUF6328 family protein [Gaiellaceae bacterium]